MNSSVWKSIREFLQNTGVNIFSCFFAWLKYFASFAEKVLLKEESDGSSETQQNNFNQKQRALGFSDHKNSQSKPQNRLKERR